MSKNYRADVDAALKELDFENNDYQVELETTRGKILLDTWYNEAPEHCKNIVGLAKIGFYDGIIAHRIIPDFVVQIGCPNGTGTGGPGYTIDAEFNDRPHEPGVLSMARTSDPNSAGSQFFICLGRIPHLDGQYTVFGKTADQESLDVVLGMANVDTNAQDKPLEDIKITASRVIEKPKP
ncbi:peptidylprolyl isomerase [Rubinisphaera sp. JC750]|uniref:peptidylprolyl isomerase n=1 Tax=Rubinisphaera sp. JC750 TaxID=2898658 RepID=UPI001F24209B|nr:peptidylprolyl isomerase [Rubinisphaera sp. JC750]